ncbi:MAG: DUF721 domain-containing protein [Alphaproteobacteria bacterium]|nr:DUF721 domain-containing protein [Alphaproteobacteria bacterium]
MREYPCHPYPKTLQHLVTRIASPLIKQTGLYEPRLLTDWHHIVGHTLSRFSMPLNIRFPQGRTAGGVLYIAVNHAGFSTEFNHLKPQLLEKIATYFGYQAVADIKIILKLGMKIDTKQAVETNSSAQQPINPAVLTYVNVHIADTELATSLASLGSHISEIQSS